MWHLISRANGRVCRTWRAAGLISTLQATRAKTVDGQSAKRLPALARFKSGGSSVFVCGSCGEDFPKWSGQCPACREWNTLKQPRVSTTAGGPGTTRNVSPGSYRGATAGLKDEAAAAAPRAGWLPQTSAGKALTPLSSVRATTHTRIPFGSRELDRVFGGGLALGSVTLLAGNPGIGKSTLLLQIAALLSGAERTDAGVRYRDWFRHAHMQAPIQTPTVGTMQKGAAAEASTAPSTADAGTDTGVVVFVSGEESVEQLKSRADRLHISCERTLVLNETRVETILDALAALQDRLKPADATTPSKMACVIIDSVQTMFTDAVAAPAGSVSQVRESAVRLLHFAKAHQVPLFLIGHVTKSGDIAGPRVLEHLVDTVIYVETADEVAGVGVMGSAGPAGARDGGNYGASTSSTRLMRTIKNRFGSTSEVGLFEMTEDGLRETNPAQLFLSETPSDGSRGETATPLHQGTGRCVTVTVEGTRPLCVEVQALATRTAFPYPRHRCTGLTLDRVHMLTAVLMRHARVRLHHDLFLNVVGGLRLSDPAVDLAAVMAIVSSVLNQPLPLRTVFCGETGLTGEIRPVSRLPARLAAAAQLGFAEAIVPYDRVVATAQPANSNAGALRVVRVRTLAEAIKRVFGEDVQQQVTRSARAEDVFSPASSPRDLPAHTDASDAVQLQHFVPVPRKSSLAANRDETVDVASAVIGDTTMEAYLARADSSTGE